MSALPTVAHVVDCLDQLLDPTRREDYGPNGLQVDASADHPLTATACRVIVTGVTANLAFLREATARGADLAVVHHGLFWGSTPPTATGAHGRRLAHCLRHNLSLAAYHLPLDAHLEVGNAAGLARALGLEHLAPAFPWKGLPTGVRGELNPPLTPAGLAARLRAISDRALLFEGGRPLVHSVGIVTGGAPRLAAEAAAMGLDAYLTGEATEHTQATALEEGIHIGALGHHRTETFGPRALADHLATLFPTVRVEFVDVDNPV